MEVRRRKQRAGYESSLQAALAIRKICESSTKWKFDGLMDLDAYEVPEKLALFFKWCLVGKASVTKNISRVNEVSDRSKRLSQILMFECLTSRQAGCFISYDIKHPWHEHHLE